MQVALMMRTKCMLAICSNDFIGPQTNFGTAYVARPLV